MFPRGARYEGEFLVGKFHGYGIYHSESGMKYEVNYIWIAGLSNYHHHLQSPGTICRWASKGERSSYSARWFPW